MKVLTRSLSLLTLASLVLFFANCGGSGDGGSNKQKKQLSKLKGTWTLTNATLEGDPRTDDFDNFKLTIGGDYNGDNPDGPYTYSTTGSTPEPGPWPEIGDWEFSSISSSNVNILRDPGSDDEIAMSYHFDGDNLIMELFLDSDSEGWRTSRTAVVSGSWEFTFTK